MRLGVDVDGVLADFNTAYNLLVERELGIVLPPPSSTYPDTWDYDLAAGVTKEERRRLWRLIEEHPSWRASLQPYPESRRAISRLNALTLWHDIYFITTRPGRTAKQQTEAWLRRFGFHNPTVLIASGAASKGLLARGLGLDLFVDDNLDNVIEVRRKLRSEATVLLLDRPWNRAPLQSGITRVPTVDEALKFVRDVEEVKVA